MTAALVFANQDIAYESQRVFRCLLQGMAEPGMIATVSTSIQCPVQLGQAQAAVALTLFDHETAVWLSPRLRVPAVETFLRFHTGASLVDAPGAAAFALVDSTVNLPALDAFAIGTDESPEHGATLIVETALIASGSGKILRGPGIPTVRTLELWGVPDTFWSARGEICALHPRGVDFIFTCGDSMAALPRTTQTEG